MFDQINTLLNKIFSNEESTIFSLLINTRNANSFTGEQGYKSMQSIAEIISKTLNEKQKKDEENPIKIKPKKSNLILKMVNIQQGEEKHQ